MTGPPWNHDRTDDGAAETMAAGAAVEGPEGVVEPVDLVRPGTTLARLVAAPMLYPNAYVWFVFVSSLDLMLTWAILASGGAEVNPIADRVISTWGLPGAIAFKFGLTLFVIMICEFTGRTRPGVGRRLSVLAVLISALPVVYSLLLLTLHAYAQMW